MRKITIPEWAITFPDNARFMSKDVLRLFSYSSKSNITTLIKQKNIPEPDGTIKRTRGVAVKLYWRLGTLRAIAVKQNNGES